MKTLVVGIAMVASSMTCMAGSPNIDIYNPRPSFISGRQYETFSRTERQRYLAGVIDGFSFAPNLSSPKEHVVVDNLGHCIQKLHLTDDHLVAIVDRRLAQHPDEWDFPMHWTVIGAMTDACKKSGNPLF